MAETKTEPKKAPDPAWERLAETRKNKQPTPPVGWPVQWLLGGDESQIRAATVTAIEGPGRVCLQIHSVGQMPMHKRGVHYVAHPVNQVKHNATTKNNGSWRYVPGLHPEIPDEHYDLHREQISKIEDNLNHRDEEVRIAARKRQEELRKAGMIA